MAIEKIELSEALQNLATQNNIDKVTGVYNGVPANIAKADLASVVAGQMKYNASKMVLDFRESNTANVPIPSYGLVLLSVLYGSELYGTYLVQCWDGVISITPIKESSNHFTLSFNTYQKYITITSPSAVHSVRLGWINITD